MEKYAQALDTLNDDPQTLFPVLLARDQVEETLGKARPLPVESARQLVDLDGKLRQGVAEPALKTLSDWRQTLHPPNAHWWWFLDQKAEEREKKNDLPWVLLTGTLVLLTVTLATEMFKRLLVGAPDALSTAGALIILLLTGSPLFKRGQELSIRVLGRVPRLKPRFHAEAMAAMAVIAFVLVGIGGLLLPQLALYYNNEGHRMLRVGNLAAAQRAFQRAAALNPDLVAPYQNLADVYGRIGHPDEAQTWYQKAIERDVNFAPAYRGLGHLYNLQGDFCQAEKVLLAGLDQKYSPEDADLETVTRYQLLSDLGWAYFAQERLDRAQAVLEAAISMEDEIKALGEQRGVEYRLALPHYILAQVYEQSAHPLEAIEQWEESLRFLDPENWADQEQIATALSHIEQLEEENQP
jgi:tetratricopeptide (TPR) repeat protein